MGQYTCKLLATDFELVRISKSGDVDYTADCSDAEALDGILKKETPDIVVNAAKAKTSADECEGNKNDTWLANTRLPVNLAKAQARFGYRLIHISSDWVYEGKKDDVYSEESLLYPQNFYSYTKAVADEVVQHVCEDYVILRPEAIFGIDGRQSNVFCRIKTAMEGNMPIKMNKDQYSQPIYAGLLAMIISKCCKNGVSGVYNAAGPDYVSRYDLALMFCEEMGWNKELIVATSCVERSIRIPQYLRLSINKLERDILRPPALKEQIRLFKGEELCAQK